MGRKSKPYATMADGPDSYLFRKDGKQKLVGSADNDPEAGEEELAEDEGYQYRTYTDYEDDNMKIWHEGKAPGGDWEIIDRSPYAEMDEFAWDLYVDFHKQYGRWPNQQESRKIEDLEYNVMTKMNEELNKIRELAGLPPIAEDCDETPGDDKNDDGDCSPFTHADENVDMVKEEEQCPECGGVGQVWGKACEVCGGEDNLEEDYHDEEVQRFMDMGKRNLWILYNETLEDEDYPGRTDELQYMEAALDRLGISVAEGVMDEDFLAPPKDVEHGHYEDEGEDDDDWDMRDAPELDRQTNFDAPSRYDGDDSYDMYEQGPEDEFDVDPDAMVDVGDDEDYEDFDFEDEFDAMMGNTTRFESVEEQIVAMNELRKAAGLEPIAESEEVEESEVVNESLPTHGPSEWWKNDPEVLMRYIYWQRGQLPPENKQEAWDSIVASLNAKHPAPEGEIPTLEEVMEGEGDTCSRCRKGKMRRGETFMGPAEQCDHCNFQRQVEAVEEGEGDKCARCRKGTMERGETFFGPAERCNHCGFQRQLDESAPHPTDDTVPFEFNDEKAYYLVADEIGDRISFGQFDEILVPEQYVDGIIMLLDTHGFEQGKDFVISTMDEDLQNGYGEHEYADAYDDYFPRGSHQSPSDDLGPTASGYGDNAMKNRMRSKDAEDVYESMKQKYRRYRLS